MDDEFSKTKKNCHCLKTNFLKMSIKNLILVATIGKCSYKIQWESRNLITKLYNDPY